MNDRMGIPRTAAAARKRGYKKSSKIDFETMPKKERNSWVFLSNTKGLRTGQLAAFKVEGPIESMGHAPGFTKLCYKEKSTEAPLDCYDVPDSELEYYRQHPDIRPSH